MTLASSSNRWLNDPNILIMVLLLLMMTVSTTKIVTNVLHEMSLQVIRFIPPFW
jgi:hypothetical protein